MHYRKKKTRRNLVLKGRQQGLSKEIDADQLIDCIKKSTNAVVISHEKVATQRLFAAVKYYVDNLEVKPTLSIDSKSELKFPKIGSSYFIGTAGQRAFGRGDTIDRAHLSEADFYADLEMILAGIAEAAEYGSIDIETTPNGRRHFYDLWQKAKRGKSPYTPIFIPWYMNEEYDTNMMTEAEKAGLSPAVQEVFDTPDTEIILTDQERDVVRRAESEQGLIVTPGQIKWRRYKIWDKGDIFYQEYPEDDESCFLQSGRAVFKHIKVDPSLRVPLDDPEMLTAEQKDKYLGNKEKKIKRKLLYAGLDPAEGTPTGDSHCLAVIEADVKTGKGVVIYEMHSNEPIDIFGVKVQKLMHRYNISLAVEKNGVGLAMCRQLDNLDVAYEEFVTGATNRPFMVTELEEGYRKEDLIETYPDAEGEALNMVYNNHNRPEHPAGKHDDRVFARAIAYQQVKAPQPSIEFFG